jgi:hypothetical protein
MPTDQLRTKVLRTIGGHARWKELSTTEFTARYGWHEEQMIRDVQHALEHGCGYCGDAYTALRDVTFDVKDQREEPDYATNVTLCCNRCNSSKGDTPLANWPGRPTRTR